MNLDEKIPTRHLHHWPGSKMPEPLLTPDALLTLPAGSIVRMTTRMLTGERTETAYLAWRERLDDGAVYFGFHPCERRDSVRCTFGCSKLYASPKPFGLQALTVVRIAS